MKFKAGRKILTTASLLMLGTLVTGTIIAKENSQLISAYLNAKTFEVVEKGDGTADTIYFKSKFNNLRDVKDNAMATVKKEVAEGTVLLKNENHALPLAVGSKISVLGMGAYDPVYGGTGSGGITADAVVNYADSMADAGLVVNPTLKENYTSDAWKQYKRGKTGNYGTSRVLINDVPWNVVEPVAGESITTYGDAAFYVVSRQGGEGYDIDKDADGIDNNDGRGKDYLGINEAEKSCIDALKSLKRDGKVKKIIIIVNFSSMVEGDFIKDPEIDAAIWAGAAGNGNSVFGKIITGEINPSGRLADTMYMDNALNPINVNFGKNLYENATDLGVDMHVGTLAYPEVTLGSYMVYQEGMYLGYKYTETRYEDTVLETANVGDYNYSNVVAYPFGHGLSYSEFEYSNLQLNKTGDREYTVKIDVTNKSTSTLSGKVSVPVYISKPYSQYAKDNGIQVPSVELIDYAKTQVIAPGKTEHVTIKLDEKFFASYDANLAKTYVLQDGDYYIAVGGSSHDAVNNVLKAKESNGIHVNADKMVGTGNSDLVAKVHLGFDKVKYSRSDVRSTLDNQYHEITNLFDESDINKYSGRGDNHVDYYDRQHWDRVSLDQVNGSPKLKMTEQMAMEVYAQIPDETGVYNNIPGVPAKYKQPIPADSVEYPTYNKAAGLKLIDLMKDSDGKEISFFDPIWDTFLDQLSWEDTVALCSSGQHLTEAVASIAKPQTKDENGPNGFRLSYVGGGRDGAVRPNALYFLQEKALGHVNDDGSLNLDTITDSEWVRQQKGTGYTCNGLLAASFNKELAREVGEACGEEGLWAGYSGIYGTGLNIHRSPYLGRTSEYFSEDGLLTGKQAAQYSAGIESKGVHVYNKHCALNELEQNRHGVQVWINEQALRETYLRAFELPIVEGGAWNIMASFSRFGTVSGAANGRLNNNYLRGECGLKGIIVTDFYGDMNGNQDVDPYYEQVYGTYYGGCDIPDGNQPMTGEHFKKYQHGYGTMAWRMRECCKRLCYQTLWCNAMNGLSSTTEIVQLTPVWWQTLVATDVVFGVLFAGGFGWTVYALFDEIVKKHK